ncbi:UvrC excinuclease ABC subunit C [Escherichia coli]|uniref:UvrC excinuclease ABC subunit C n=1 Tax=Escherichia coli TaxID=562 RepID=A0A376TDR2_ECOLX|nr:UvrC excinuclease ABC subunit C [Escherichia coli]
MNHMITRLAGHRKKRAKVKNTSSLETIEGVGPKRRQMLLKYMGGLQGLRNASVEEIAKVPGISQGLGRKDLLVVETLMSL